jgi:hypothetical protein
MKQSCILFEVCVGRLRRGASAPDDNLALNQGVVRTAGRCRRYRTLSQGFANPHFTPAIINMGDSRTDTHQAKRVRVGERTMLACIGCKQKKLKVRAFNAIEAGAC